MIWAALTTVEVGAGVKVGAAVASSVGSPGTGGVIVPAGSAGVTGVTSPVGSEGEGGIGVSDKL